MPNSGFLASTRREIVAAGGACAVAATFPSPVGAQAGGSAMSQASVTLRVNGTQRTLDLDVRTSLLDALREHLHLTGTK